MTNRIQDYRRIGNWENFFLDSAVYSIAESVGITYDNSFTPIAAITGDLFTYMYSETIPCDSGLTNYILMPDRVVKAFSSFGWKCEYFSKQEVERDINAVIQKIHASIDRGYLVLAWGVGGVPGMRQDQPMGEGALIGGYDDEALLIHLYCGAERLPEKAFDGRPCVDDDGYTAIPAKAALAGTDGIFILTEKITPTDVKTVYREAVMRIPDWLTMIPTGGRVSKTEQYAFGKAAFTQWSEVLMDDTAWRDCDENMIWDKHCCAYCSLCTSTNRVVDWLKRAEAACPELSVITDILPTYQKQSELCQKVWDFQGGFMPSTDKMQLHDYRANIAAILQKMGNCCHDILQAFEKIELMSI